jgi:hypothetical protein
MRKRIFIAVLLTIGLCAQVKDGLGSGNRGLCFSMEWSKEPKWDPKDKKGLPAQDLAILAIDPNPPLGEGIPGYVKGKGIILHQEILSEEYRNSIPSKWWTGSFFNVYSFDDHSVFNSSGLLRLEEGHLRIYPWEAQKIAHQEFKLPENALYLGVVSAYRFYWIKGHPRYVYAFKVGEQPRKLLRFKLDKRVTEPLGIAKGEPEGDLALRAVAKPIRWSPSPRIIPWFVLNFKDTESVK